MKFSKQSTKSWGTSWSLGRFDLMIGALDAVVAAVLVVPARFKPLAVLVPCLAAALIGDKVGPLIVSTFGSWFTLVIDDCAAGFSAFGVSVAAAAGAALG